MKSGYLDKVKEPGDLKRFSVNELASLSEEIRDFLIDSISKTGGHIGANLGVIELTVALHYVFSMPEDKIIFDTGHQGYTHKLLTNRKELFKTLNQRGGMSRFLTRDESDYDVIDASHAGTAISIASGFALKKALKHTQENVVAVVGDGSLVEGMSAEGLNYIPEVQLPMVVVINDNGMSIPVNVGGIRILFSGKDWQKKSRNHFEGLGYEFFCVEDGHDMESLVTVLKQAQKASRNHAVVVHVKTEKGKGLAIAKNHKYKLHFSMPFDPRTGAGTSPVPAGKTYAVVAGDKLCEVMKQNEDIVIFTPSTPYASGIDHCFECFPERTIDVGMAEQHALGQAAGLAMAGLKPFVCYQSTFMQRAFDQLIHDVAFMNLPVTIMGVRSGFAGYDSSTHHGIYDLSYLRCIPNLKIFYPGTAYELETMIEERGKSPDGPMLILYPYEKVRAEEDQEQPRDKSLKGAQVVHQSRTGYILSVGNSLGTAFKLRKLLASRNVDFGVVNIRWISPLPQEQLLSLMKSVQYVVTLEENVLDGGFGGSIAELISDHEPGCKLLRSGIEKCFVGPGDKDDLCKEVRIDAESILKIMEQRWPDLF
ncbi:MAG: 1-deoxy-D-xylulose-5-phosphate synthase [Candidatus Omnitrophota bacterium]